MAFSVPHVGIPVTGAEAVQKTTSLKKNYKPGKKTTGTPEKLQRHIYKKLRSATKRCKNIAKAVHRTDTHTGVGPIEVPGLWLRVRCVVWVPADSLCTAPSHATTQSGRHSPRGHVAIAAQVRVPFCGDACFTAKSDALRCTPDGGGTGPRA